MKMSKESLEKLIEIITKKVKQEIMKDIKSDINEQIKFALSLVTENKTNIQLQNQSEIKEEEKKVDTSDFKKKLMKEFNIIEPLKSPLGKKSVTIQGHDGAIINPDTPEGQKLLEIQTKDYRDIMKKMNEKS